MPGRVRVIERSGSGCGLPDDLRIVFGDDQGAQPAVNQFLIVDDEHAHPSTAVPESTTM